MRLLNSRHFSWWGQAVDEVVTCPNCSRKLKVRTENLGRLLACPACQHEFEIALDPPPAEPKVSGQPRMTANDFAYIHGINLEEAHNRQLSSSGQADHALKCWKGELPEAKPAYRASGKMPPGALLYLGGGAIAGAVAGPATAVAIGALTAVVVWVMFWIRIHCLFFVFGVIFGVIGYAAAFLFMGVAAARLTGLAGKLAKNRNPGASSWMSVVSAAGGLSVLVGAANYANVNYLHYPLPRLDQITWPEIGVAAAATVGAITAIITAAIRGWHMVQSTKFCEACEEYMEETKLPGLRLGRLKGVAQALKEMEYGHAADLLRGGRGENGLAELFHCPGCGCGYLDVHATFNATWKGSEGDESKLEKWLVASVALSKDEIDLFLPYSH